MMLQGAVVGFDLSDKRTADDVKRIPLATMYQTSDERTVLLSILNPEKEWPKLCRAVAKEEWIDAPRFKDVEARFAHRDELYDALAAIFRADTAASWRTRLDEAEVTYSVAYTMSEVINDEQMHANDVLTEMAPGDHFYAYTVNSPVWIEGVGKRTPRLAPKIGEHTREVLREAGFGADEVHAMLDAGIVRDDTGSSL